MEQKKINYLSKLGYSFEKGGAHTSRTIMLEELKLLLSFVGNHDAAKDVYINAIEEDNCLGKRSGRTRILTARHMVDLYSLDNSVLLFRTLQYFWNRDINAQPLLALLCAYARDTVLRMSAPFILSHGQGAVVRREALESYIETKQPDRFSKATLKSTAQNINSSFTKSGHLTGKVKKIRTQAQATPGATAYALLLGYLRGSRGISLFKTEYVKLLDCSYEKKIELAERASQSGWIVFKRVGDVIEVLFPNLINNKELELLREQN